MGLKEWYGDKSTAGQILTAGIFTLIAALIGGIFTLIAANIKPDVSVPATATPQAHTLITKHTPSYSPSPTPALSSSAVPPVQTPDPTLTPSPARIPVVTPTEQPGWTLEWHQKVSIQSPGVVITRVGYTVGDGSNFDLQYVPGNGWAAGNNIVEIDNWPVNLKPGPAAINGFLNAGDATSSPVGSVAHVGDTIDWINENNVIGYLDVTAVNSQGIDVDMWVWIKN